MSFILGMTGKFRCQGWKVTEWARTGIVLMKAARSLGLEVKEEASAGDGTNAAMKRHPNNQLKMEHNWVVKKIAAAGVTIGGWISAQTWYQHCVSSSHLIMCPLTAMLSHPDHVSAMLCLCWPLMIVFLIYSISNSFPDFFFQFHETIISLFLIFLFQLQFLQFTSILDQNFINFPIFSHDFILNPAYFMNFFFYLLFILLLYFTPSFLTSSSYIFLFLMSKWKPFSPYLFL